ncbi:MAG: AAA family ATPase [Oscillospiraceae bacterium]|nr:AAA family ATPase [Oscillospiraceae bacterium]
MMIKRLDATFGKLEGESLELHDGLNVISAPNESGKSTWCAFVRAMLYGVDSSERQKAGFLPDKMRFAPWSGSAMQGSMQLESGGRDITITRTTKTASAPMREFSAVYTGTSVSVEGLNGNNAGEMLTGVSRDVFRRSAFVEQGKVAVTHSAELEKRISAIVSSGDEDCSFTEADGRLRQWQRKRRFNRHGRLPELEDELSHKKQLLAELSDAAQQRENMSAELERAKQECERIEAEVIESRKVVRKEALSSLQGVRNEVNAATERHDKAAERRDSCRAALCACAIGERKPEEAKAEVKTDLENSMKLKERSERKSSPVLAIILMILCGALVAAGFLLPDLMIHAFVAAAVALAAGIALFIRASRRKTENYEAAKQRRKILAKYKAESEADIAASIDEYLELYKNYAEAQRAEKESAEALAVVRRRQEQAESKTLTQLDFTGGDNQAAQLSRRLTEARAKCSRISAQMAEHSGRLAAMGDPLVLGSEISRMEAEYAEISAEYDAIALAIDTMRKADEDIQSRFSPALGKLAAEYMQFVTDGKYDGVMLDRDFSATVHEAGGNVPRNAEYLSAGTLDLMYLAVRLAVCSLALPESANCPLIIDDALVNFDADRRRQAMALLEKIAQERQVILFACN